jgi:catechol 2,3-dioxygenase-like lactoylglutathione lyase family enzyme
VGVQVHHVNIVAKPGGAEATADFYAGVFGLERIPKLPGTGAGGAWLQIDAAVQLHISERDGPASPDAHIAFMVDDFAAVRARVQERGAPWQDGADIFRGGRGFTRDPAGNRIEILERAGMLATP